MPLGVCQPFHRELDSENVHAIIHQQFDRIGVGENVWKMSISIHESTFSSKQDVSLIDQLYLPRHGEDYPSHIRLQIHLIQTLQDISIKGLRNMQKTRLSIQSKVDATADPAAAAKNIKLFSLTSDINRKQKVEAVKLELEIGHVEEII